MVYFTISREKKKKNLTNIFRILVNNLFLKKFYKKIINVLTEFLYFL